MDLQELANKNGRKVYLYRMHDYSLEHSFNKYCKGDRLNGKIVLEEIGAYVPQHAY